MSNIIEEIYVLVNLIQNQNHYTYLVPNYDKNKSLIDAKKFDELKLIYKNSEILKNLKEDSKIISLNVATLTVNEFKYHLADYLKEIPEDLFIYGKLNNVNQRLVNELSKRKELFNESIYKDVTIGFSYKNEFGTRSLIGNFVNATDKDLNQNSLDMMNDESHYIMSNYSIKNNLIFVSSKTDLERLETSGRITAQKSKQIKDLYFPFKNKYSDEEYKLHNDERLTNLKELNKKMNKISGIQNVESNYLGLKYANLVFEINSHARNNVEIQSIFKELEFDNSFVFMRYADNIKNNFYRMNNKILFPNISKFSHNYNSLHINIKQLRNELSSLNAEIYKINSNYSSKNPIQNPDLNLVIEKEMKKDEILAEIKSLELEKRKLESDGDINFSDVKNYFIEYTEGKYKSILNKKTILNWKKGIFLEREQENKDRLKNVEQLEIKLLFFQSSIKKYIFPTLFISKFGETHLKCTDLATTYNLNKFEIKKVISLANGVITKINKIVSKRGGSKIHNIEQSNMELNSFDIVNHFKLSDDDNFNELKKRASANNQFGFFVENNENTFTYKYLRTNNGYSDQNAKKYFFLLKKNAGQVGVTTLRNMWISEAAKIFNYSRIEALNMLESLGEEVELDDFKNNEMSDIQDIIFTKSDEAGIILVNIINLSNENDLEKALKFVTFLLDNKFSTESLPQSAKATPNKTTTKPSTKSPVIIRAEIKTQAFANDDNIDIDIDYSDSDEDSEDDEDSLSTKEVANAQPEPEPEPEPEPPSEQKSESSPKQTEGVLLKGDTKRATKKLPSSIREYMVNMRKEKDPRLFVFKKSNMFDSYSSKCGAVDMRQPILVNKYEIDNMMRNEYSKRALERYKDSHLLWGSSKTNLNFYMCPRIWCIRDNVEITPIDFLLAGSKCPICGGGIINPEDKKISQSHTILLRRGKANNYWGDSTVPEDFLQDIPIYANKFLPKQQELIDLQNDDKSSKEAIKKIKLELEAIQNAPDDKYKKSINEFKTMWNKSLKNTEKIAFPSFLKSKTHPEDMCMPCCNATKKILDTERNIKAIPNYEKCLIHKVTAFIILEFTNLQDISELKKKLVPGFEVKNMEINKGFTYERVLELNDTVLIINKSNKDKKNNTDNNLVLIVKADGAKILNKFTDNEIPYMNGVTFELTDLNAKWVSYRVPENLKTNVNRAIAIVNYEPEPKNSEELKLVKDQTFTILDDVVLKGTNKFLKVRKTGHTTIGLVKPNFVRRLTSPADNEIIEKADKADDFLKELVSLKYQIKDPKAKINLQYILGKEKFPLPNKKFGIFVDSIDSLLNANSHSKIQKGNIDFERVQATSKIVAEYNSVKDTQKRRNFFYKHGIPDLEHMNKHKHQNKNKFETGDLLIRNFSEYLRSGVNQNPKFSIYGIFQRVRGIDNLETFIQLLIDILTPELFLSLNCGEIYKAFIPSEFDYKNERFLKYFEKWIEHYDDFVKMEFPKFRKIKQSRIKQLINITNKTGFELANLYTIHAAHENYKKFISDLNIEKKYDFVIDLLCSPINLPKHKLKRLESLGVTTLEITKLNPYLIDYNEKTDKINVVNPPFKDLWQVYDFTRNSQNIMIYRSDNLYENIVHKYVWQEFVIRDKKTAVNQNTNDTFLIMNDTNPTSSSKQTLIDRLFAIMKMNDIQDDYGRKMTELKQLQKSDIQIEKYIIDRYYKGIGVIGKYKGIYCVIYVKPFKFDKTLPNIKFDYSSFERYTPNIKDLMKVYNHLNEREIPFYRLEGLHINKNNKILGIYTENNLLIPVAKENNTGQFGLPVLSTGEVNDIDFLLNTETDITDIRKEKADELIHKQALFNIFKFTLSQFFKKSTKIIKTAKRQLENILNNYGYPNHLKHEAIHDILRPFLLKVFSIIETSSNTKETCIDKKESKCLLIKDCKYSKINGDNNICKKVISKKNLDILSNYLINELIYFPNIKTSILNGTYKINKDIDLIELKDVLVDVSFESQIENLFGKNKMVYVNKNYTDSFIKSDDILEDAILSYKRGASESNSSPIKQKITKSVSSKPPPTETEPVVITTRNNNTSLPKSVSSSNDNLTSQIQASTIGWDGKDYSSDPMVKAGPCLPTFKIRSDIKSPYQTYENGCDFITNTKKFPKERGKICATSVKTNAGTHNGYLETYGICPKTDVDKKMYGDNKKVVPKTKSATPKIVKSAKINTPTARNNGNKKTGKELLDDEGNLVKPVYADKKDLFGNPIENQPHLKEGMCKFPFKLRTGKYPITTYPRGRVYDVAPEFKGKQKETEFYDCIPFDRDKKDEKQYGYWCPTELNEKGKWKKKGICKSYGPNGKPITQKQSIVKADKSSTSKPVKKQTVKAKKSSKPTNSKPLQTDEKIKNIWGVDFEFDNYRKVPIKSSKVKAGKCKFPFKYNPKKYKKDYHYDCLDDPSGRYKFCATEVNKHKTLVKSGRCLPENRTPEQMEQMIQKAKEIKKKDGPKFSFVPKSKKAILGSLNNTNTRTKKARKVNLNSDNWISSQFGAGFLINEDIDNRGDCFFDCIHTALEEVGIKISIQDLRNIVRENITQDNFDLYKEIYQNAVNHEDEQIMSETSFIMELDTLADLQDFIMTKKYWADMLSISIIERVLSLKVILFDEEMFKRGVLSKVINCGNNLNKFTIVKCSISGVTSIKHEKILKNEVPDEEIIPFLLEHGIDIDKVDNIRNEYLKLSKNDAHNFIEYDLTAETNPDKFILLNYENGNHYKLVYYNKKSVFKKLNELPDDVNQAIKSKCGKIKAFNSF